MNPHELKSEFFSWNGIHARVILTNDLSGIKVDKFERIYLKIAKNIMHKKCQLH